MDIVTKIKLWDMVTANGALSNSITDYPVLIQQWITSTSDWSWMWFLIGWGNLVVAVVLMWGSVAAYYRAKNDMGCEWALDSDNDLHPLLAVVFGIGFIWFFVAVALILSNLEWYWIANDLQNFIARELM